MSWGCWTGGATGERSGGRSAREDGGTLGRPPWLADGGWGHCINKAQGGIRKPLTCSYRLFFTWERESQAVSSRRGTSVWMGTVAVMTRMDSRGTRTGGAGGPGAQAGEVGREPQYPLLMGSL